MGTILLLGSTDGYQNNENPIFIKSPSVIWRKMPLVWDRD